MSEEKQQAIGMWLDWAIKLCVPFGSLAIIFGGWQLREINCSIESVDSKVSVLEHRTDSLEQFRSATEASKFTSADAVRMQETYMKTAAATQEQLSALAAGVAALTESVSRMKELQNTYMSRIDQVREDVAALRGRKE